MTKVGLLGGDEREKVLISLLVDKGYKVKVLHSSNCSDENVEYTTDITKLTECCKAIIAPMSGTDEEGYLKSTFVDGKIRLDDSFVGLLKKDQLFFIGIARPVLKKPLTDKEINFIEMAKLSDVAILNAIPTAEGAIKEAIARTDFTIYNSKVLITGLGKVGLTLAWRLKALGAETYSATRDRGSIARGKDLGLKMISYNNLDDYLSEMEIIFNTVPALIFDKSYLSVMKKDVVILDLASSPGGIDFAAAQNLGINAALLPGLPGKVAPITSAKIMADVIHDKVIGLN